METAPPEQYSKSLIKEKQRRKEENQKHNAHYSPASVTPDLTNQPPWENKTNTRHGGTPFLGDT